MNIFLSNEVSALENMRRLAEHNSFTTFESDKAYNHAVNFPLEEIRKPCVIMMIGTIATGILFACFRSKFEGSLILISTLIPCAISHHYSEKHNRLLAIMQVEGQKTEIIYKQMGLLFFDACKQMQRDIYPLWNDNKIYEVASKKELVLMQENFLESFFERDFCYLQSKTTYKNLRTYATIISTILPEDPRPKDLFHQYVLEKPFFLKLQEACKEFLKKEFIDFQKHEIDESDEKEDSFKSVENPVRWIIYKERDDDGERQKKIGVHLRRRKLKFN